jgi:succinate dehydrogenase/fumarate reductase flavoprotein subunit
MGASDVLQIAGQYGANGLFIAYLILRDAAERKERREAAVRRETIEKDDIAARKELAVSMTALSMVIQGRPHV